MKTMSRSAGRSVRADREICNKKYHLELLEKKLARFVTSRYFPPKLETLAQLLKKIPSGFDFFKIISEFFENCLIFEKSDLLFSVMGFRLFLL